ncbi:hypothetical protein RSal33209_0858 [Renibacterium salmoninarum ATCC 33209]|uniref:Uncharacterized protein n=1 Tax=Renibacterium salmoninarum (strain ATCC 33209 / DSM 20767 / JCM 11484 / NBRC 15589 / NCIMB 2235) TaxID=288705 RepID=A9WQF2_RENSM|nr:hypothetical protein RSal33209_0858 [Renibacterium salmoninarum ATCC 33209]
MFQLWKVLRPAGDLLRDSVLEPLSLLRSYLAQGHRAGQVLLRSGDPRRRTCLSGQRREGVIAATVAAASMVPAAAFALRTTYLRTFCVFISPLFQTFLGPASS